MFRALKLILYRQKWKHSYLYECSTPTAPRKEQEEEKNRNQTHGGIEREKKIAVTRNEWNDKKKRKIYGKHVQKRLAKNENPTFYDQNHTFSIQALFSLT